MNTDQESDDEIDKIINSPVKIDAPIKVFERLAFIVIRIENLCDHIRVVNTNRDQLKAIGNRKNIKLGQKPAFQLYEYLILELCSFYDYIKELNKVIKKIKKNPNVEPQELIKTIIKNPDENEKDQYTRLIKKFRENPKIEFPNLPKYLEEIYTFRGVIVAHLDKHGSLKDRQDFIDAYQPLFKDDRIENILIPDFEKYYGECLDRFGEFINRSHKA